MFKLVLERQRNQKLNCQHPLDHGKGREFQKNIYFWFIDYAKAFGCVDHNKLWKTLKEMRIPDHLSCFLSNLYTGQEAIVWTGHGTTDWFQIGKGVYQSCIVSPCLFNLYVEYMMQNARLDEAGIKVSGEISITSDMQMTLPLFSSVQFSCLVMSDTLRPHGPQHTRPSCPSPTPRVYPNSCPLSQWCHPTIWSSVIPFASCPQSFPASGSFQMSQLFASGGQSIGVSASTSVLPMNTQDWSPLVWTGWTSLQSKRLSRVFSNTTVQKHQFFGDHPKGRMQRRNKEPLVESERRDWKSWLKTQHSEN